MIHAELTGCKDTQNRDISTIEFPEIESKPILTNSSSSEVSTKNNVEEIAQEMSADKIDQITESIASKNSVEILEQDKATSVTSSSSREK